MHLLYELSRTPPVLALAPEHVRRIADTSRRMGLESHLIAELADDAQSDLVMLSWLGSGLYAATEWEEARAEARAAQSWRTAAYLAQMPAFGDRLELGLSELTLAATHRSRYCH